MSCPTGSIASGITACWPVRHAKQTSRRSAPCSAPNVLNKPPRQSPKQRPLRLPCANHAPAAAAPCASSRYSAVARNRCRAHQQGGRPHDKMPVHPIQRVPVVFFVDRSKPTAPVIPNDRCKCGTLLYSIKYPPLIAAANALKKICGALSAVSPSTAIPLSP